MSKSNSASTPKPYDLYLAANPINELIESIRQVGLQQGRIFEQKLVDILQNDVNVQAKTEVEQSFLGAKQDETWFRCWTKTNQEQSRYSILAVEKQLVRSLMDLVCGGTGIISNEKKQEELSPGEIKILEKVIDLFYATVFESLKALDPVELLMVDKNESMSIDMQFRGIRHHIISTEYRVVLPNFSGRMILSSPTNNMRSYAIDDANNHPALRQKMIETMQAVPLPVTAILSKQESSLREVYALQPGDIVPLVSPMQAEVFVGQKSVCRAGVFTSDSKLYLKVENRQADDSDEQESDERASSSRERRRNRDRQRSSSRERRKARESQA